MALTLVSAATTGKTTSVGSLVTVNLPGSLVSGNLIVIDIIENNNKTLSRSGYTAVSGSAGAGNTWSRLSKVSDGTEGATAQLTVSSGNTDLITIATQWSGQHATTPLPNNKTSGQRGTEDPFVLSADAITGMGADSSAVLVWGSLTAQRTLTTLDADLTQFSLSASLGVSGSNACLFLAVESAPGTGNAAYSNDMSDTRDWNYALYEIVPAASGPLTASNTDGVVMGEALGTSWIVDDGADGVVMGDILTVDQIAAASGTGTGGISVSLGMGL